MLSAESWAFQCGRSFNFFSLWYFIFGYSFPLIGTRPIQMKLKTKFFSSSAITSIVSYIRYKIKERISSTDFGLNFQTKNENSKITCILKLSWIRCLPALQFPCSKLHTRFMLKTNSMRIVDVQISLSNSNSFQSTTMLNACIFCESNNVIASALLPIAEAKIVYRMFIFFSPNTQWSRN